MIAVATILSYIKRSAWLVVRHVERLAPNYLAIVRRHTIDVNILTTMKIDGTGCVIVYLARRAAIARKIHGLAVVIMSRNIIFVLLMSYYCVGKPRCSQNQHGI
jgi:hypothetical protein